MKKIFLSVFLLAMLFMPSLVKGESAMKITSPEFQPNSSIPFKFTCQGADLSPTLEISGTPADAKSLVLIVDDPDAPVGTWVHWVVFNIDPKTTVIREDSAPGTRGWNSFGRMEWGGPCPPRGTHRYFFKIYALETVLSVREGSTRAEVEK